MFFLISTGLSYHLQSLNLTTFDYKSANWDCVSVIVKTGGDLRQEQLAVQLIREFQRIWVEENCACWVR